MSQLLETQNPTHFINHCSIPSSSTLNSPNINPDEQQEKQQQKDQYQQYIQRKRLQTIKSGQKINNYGFSLIFKAIISVVILFAFIVYFSFQQKVNSQSSHNPSSYNKSQHPFIQPQVEAYSRYQHSAAPPINTYASGSCNAHLPYSFSSQKELQRTYYQWFGKVGQNVYGMSYDVGHFIQRHVAVQGKCTPFQYAEGKSVFFDWTQVTKAFKKTSNQKCSLSDRRTFSYNFQLRIASPSEFIKGIDCRTGTIKKFSKIFVLYRRAIKNSNPYQNQYLESNHVTIWTFYPKN